jgi:integrase
MGRRRLPKNRALPQNLYFARGFYSYRHPMTGKTHGFGKNRPQAIADAKKLNAILMPKLKSDNVRTVLLEESGSLAEIANRYLKEYIPTKKLAARTMTDIDGRIRRIIRDIGAWPLESVSVRAVSEYLDQFEESPYKKMRTDLKAIFQFAIAKGLIAADFNPAGETLVKKLGKRKRQALTIEDYEAIHAQAAPWLQVAMELLLITLQRPVDLVQMKYTDIREGVLYVQQQKVARHGNWQSNLAIKVGGRLDETLKKSRLDNVITPYIIHRRPGRKTKNRGDCDHWTQVQRSYISRAFAELRDKLPRFATMDASEKPSFYEIKALGGYLYQSQFGWNEKQIQALMGHTEVEMTRLYTDRHIEWSEVAVE